MAAATGEVTLMEDFFDRQRRIPGWDQARVREQCVLVLGVGGLGCGVALSLCRLGVRKLYLVDNDVVDVHNLNRQLLFSAADVGERKVVAAARALTRAHHLCTEVVPLHLDALTEWPRVVEWMRECAVAFNAIDVGTYFDVAVQSLALKLNSTLISGGTFQHTVTVDFMPAHRRYVDRAWPVTEEEAAATGSPADAVSSAEPASPSAAPPATASPASASAVSAATASSLISEPATASPPSSSTAGAPPRTAVSQGVFAERPPCWVCLSDVENKEVLHKLVPDRILEYQSLSWIPRDDNPVGASNTYVCNTAANLMVSAFTLHLVGDEPVPNRVIFWMNRFEMVKWVMPPEPDCVLCTHNRAPNWRS
jgi:ThiF family